MADIVTYPVNNVDFKAEDVETYMCTRTSGVYAGDMDYTVTTNNNNTVTVGDGLAWMRITRFGGKSIASKTPVVLDAGLPDPVYPRIDAVVLQWSATANGTSLIIKKGVAGSSPKPPEVVRNSNIYELHLFHIKRRVGATSITPDDLVDLRQDEKYCGIMYNDVTLSGAVDFIKGSEKGKAGGVATLDSSGKVPAGQLPSMDYIKTSEKGADNGVAPLVNKKIPSFYLPPSEKPDLSGYIQKTEKGQKNGVAPLNALGKIDDDYLMGEKSSQAITATWVSSDVREATAHIVKSCGMAHILIEIYLKNPSDEINCSFRELGFNTLWDQMSIPASVYLGGGSLNIITSNAELIWPGGAGALNVYVSFAGKNDRSIRVFATVPIRETK